MARFETGQARKGTRGDRCGRRVRRRAPGDRAPGDRAPGGHAPGGHAHGGRVHGGRVRGGRVRGGHVVANRSGSGGSRRASLALAPTSPHAHGEPLPVDWRRGRRSPVGKYNDETFEPV